MKPGHTQVRVCMKAHNVRTIKKDFSWARVKAPVRARAPSVRRLYGDCGRAVCPPHTLRQSLCKGTEQPGQAGAIYSAALQSTHWRRLSRVCARRRIKGSIPAMRVNKGRSEREGEAQKGPMFVCVRALVQIGPLYVLKGDKRWVRNSVCLSPVCLFHVDAQTNRHTCGRQK